MFGVLVDPTAGDDQGLTGVVSAVMQIRGAVTWRRRGFRIVAVLAGLGSVSLGALAVAATDSASPPTGVHPASSHATAPTTGSNRRTAERDAEHRLRAVVPPAGAVLRSSETATGAHAHLLTGATASAVAYRTWTVPGDPASVLSFVQAHLPPGSRLVSRGSGDSPPMRSVIRSWAAVDGILGVRWLELQVTSRAPGGTRLYAESQSQWIIARPAGEHIPADVREVDIIDGWPGRAPFFSRRVTSAAQVHRLVRLFNSLGIVQPGSINCPSATVTPTVKVQFRPSATGRPVARASVSSHANFSWPASVPGWACFPIAVNVRGRNQSPLVGNVITPIQRLLHVKLG